MQQGMGFIARYSKKDLRAQPLWDHLLNVSYLVRERGNKVGLGNSTCLLGLVHDLGKATNEFKEYLQFKVGLKEKLGFQLDGSKLDHATAGAQVLYEELVAEGGIVTFTADILSIVVASHHGIMDALKPNGEDALGKRLDKQEYQTRKNQALTNLNPKISRKLNRLLNSNLEDEIERFLLRASEPTDTETESYFKVGLLVRYLLSCLIDADRTDAANFESGQSIINKTNSKKIKWKVLIERLESHIASFKVEKEIDLLRKDVSQKCLQAAKMEQGFFRLSVPTGGGKTLASLRFALHHAKQHQLDRVIYVIPYTSIIDQNAKRMRKALELDVQDVDIFLEHHSNLIFKKQGLDDETSEAYKKHQLLAENWNSPIISTTMVQFLETLFNSSTNSCRRMHQLANSVIIFDEIQTLPVKMVHLFNLALKFLVSGCNTSVMLCTATQPLLHKIQVSARSLPYDALKEITVSKKQKRESLNRVMVIDKTRPAGWSSRELAELAIEESDNKKSALVIVNTKRKAADVYNDLQDKVNLPIFHLSTSMYPAHRLTKLEQINEMLKERRPLILISTQLIEAGVDVDFDVVIRSLAGIDSIAQAAGRCNRHGDRDRKGRVLLINSSEENLSKLPEILCAKKKTERILAEFENNQAYFENHLLSDPAIKRFFKYYYYDRNAEMPYLVDHKTAVGRMDDLFELLSRNGQSLQAYMHRNQNQRPNRFLCQSFGTAARAFEVISDSGYGILVYHDAGKELINELAGSYVPEKQFELLRKAQRYSVNCFRYELEKLMDAGALFEVQPDANIWYVDEQFYHEELGLTIFKSGLRPTLNV